MSRIIAIANQKGGVGKTTTSINLGIGLARAGKKVCIVDLDPQANATIGLGYDNPDELEDTITTILDKMIAKDYNITTGFCILHHDEGIDLIPASVELAQMEMKLLLLCYGREKILKIYLDMIRDKYDYIIIDCNPSLNIVSLNALVAADGVLIPVQAQYYSAKGLQQLLNTINLVITEGLNPKLKIDGILFTLANARTNNFATVTEIVKGVYGENVHIFDSYIPRGVTAEEAPAAGKSIYAYDPDGRVSHAYSNFTCEFMLWEEGEQL